MQGLMKNNMARVLLAALFSCGFVGSALAAPPASNFDPAGKAMQRDMQQRQAYEGRRQSVQQQNETQVQVEKEKPAQPVDNVRFEVKEIRLNRSAILSEEEIRAAVDFHGATEMSLADLQKIVARLNALYESKQELTAMAVLPPQQIEDGIVKIHLIEGRYGKLSVQGNKRISEDYVAERVSVPTGKLCDLQLLQKDLNLYNQTNNFPLQAKLIPGGESGTSDVLLTLQEQENQWSTTLFADNGNQDNSGLYRFGFMSQAYGLGKIDDKLMLSSSWTNGTLSGYVAYDAPVGREGTRATLAFSRNRVEVKHGEFKFMEITGHSNDISAAISHPVYVSASSKGELFAELHHKMSDTAFAFGDLNDIRTDVIKAGYNLRSFDKHGVWFAQASVSGFSSDEKITGSSMKGSYQSLYLLRRQNLGHDQYLLWRTQAQNSSFRNMPASEQLSMGGMSTVRGYDESVISGYKGWLTGLEYNLPLSSRPQELRGLVFIDYGSVFSDDGAGADARSHVCGTGAGLEFNYQGWAGRLVVGVPLSQSDNVEHSKMRTHFYLQKSI